MIKKLSTTELKDVLTKLIENKNGEYIDEQSAYEELLNTVAEAVAYHGYAELVEISQSEDCNHTFSFAANDCTPDDGGIFKEYDTAVPVDVWLAAADNEQSLG